MNIGIIGVGRFGSLLEKHLSTDNTVVTFDKGDPGEELILCDLVIFAVPNKILQDIVYEYQPFISSDATVMDVGSVKVLPCEILQEEFSDRALGTHPLFGPDSAGESWDGHKMVFCKLDISDERYTAVKKVFTARGITAIESTPEEHDKMMAKTQALVHFMGRALSGIEEQEISTPDYGNLLKMMEKVTNDTWELFFDIQNLNPYAEAERKQLITKLQSLEEQIHDDQQQRTT